MTATATEKKTARNRAAAPESEAKADLPDTEPDVEDESGEFDAILPEGGRVTIRDEDGEEFEVTVRRIKSREFLLLMRVVTRGMGAGLMEVRLSGTDDRDELQQEVMALLMLAVPNAIEEFGDFLLAVCQPVRTEEAPYVTKAMYNPDPDVLIDVLGLLVEQEQDDLTLLWGKARAWISRLQKGMQARPPKKTG